MLHPLPPSHSAARIAIQETASLSGELLQELIQPRQHAPRTCGSSPRDVGIGNWLDLLFVRF